MYKVTKQLNLPLTHLIMQPNRVWVQYSKHILVEQLCHYFNINLNAVTELMEVMIRFAKPLNVSHNVGKRIEVTANIVFM